MANRIKPEYGLEIVHCCNNCKNYVKKTRQRTAGHECNRGIKQDAYRSNNCEEYVGRWKK